MRLETNRLILRPWTVADAPSLYEYAKDPAVGPIAGWPPHQSVEESRRIIQTVLNGPASFAICDKKTNKPIGAIALKLGCETDMTDKENECELGYWLGKPFWGKGYMPEAAKAVLFYGFELLDMEKIWCGYYEGNKRSKRVQEKLGFTYSHTRKNVSVPLLNEVRVGHTSYMTRNQWEAMDL